VNGTMHATYIMYPPPAAFTLQNCLCKPEMAITMAKRSLPGQWTIHSDFKMQLCKILMQSPAKWK